MNAVEPALSEITTEETVGGLPFSLLIALDIRSHALEEEDHVWISRYEGPDLLKQVVRTALERKLPTLTGEKASRRILPLEQGKRLGNTPCFSRLLNQRGSRTKYSRKRFSRHSRTFPPPPFDQELGSRVGTQAESGKAITHIRGIARLVGV
jgi:hypothetical protein